MCETLLPNIARHSVTKSNLLPMNEYAMAPNLVDPLRNHEQTHYYMHRTITDIEYRACFIFRSNMLASDTQLGWLGRERLRAIVYCLVHALHRSC